MVLGGRTAGSRGHDPGGGGDKRAAGHSAGRGNPDRAQDSLIEERRVQGSQGGWISQGREERAVPSPTHRAGEVSRGCLCLKLRAHQCTHLRNQPQDVEEAGTRVPRAHRGLEEKPCIN